MLSQLDWDSMFRHALAPLLAPASVALVGASEREGALGPPGLAEPCRRRPARRAVAPVNPKHKNWSSGSAATRACATCRRRRTWRCFVTPAQTIPALLDEAGAAGVRAAVVLSSGFGETGEAAARRAAGAGARPRLRAVHGLRVLGPNCLGLMRTDAGLNATFSPVAALAGPARAAVAVRRHLHRDPRLGEARRASASAAWCRWAPPPTSISANCSTSSSPTPATDAVLMYVEGHPRRATLHLGAARGRARQARGGAQGRAATPAGTRTPPPATLARSMGSGCGVRCRAAPGRHGARAQLHAAVRRGAPARRRPAYAPPASGWRSSPMAAAPA